MKEFKISDVYIGRKILDTVTKTIHDIVILPSP